MLKNRYSVGDVIGVRTFCSAGYGYERLESRPVFLAPIRYIDSQAIAVEIDQWWIFFDRRGTQLTSFYEGFQPQYALLDSQQKT
jgi:hypothetical protein